MSLRNTMNEKPNGIGDEFYLWVGTNKRVEKFTHFDGNIYRSMDSDVTRSYTDIRWSVVSSDPNMALINHVNEMLHVAENTLNNANVRVENAKFRKRKVEKQLEELREKLPEYFL